jgi:hypothetical protein
MIHVWSPDLDHPYWEVNRCLNWKHWRKLHLMTRHRNTWLSVSPETWLNRQHKNISVGSKNTSQLVNFFSVWKLLMHIHLQIVYPTHRKEPTFLRTVMQGQISIIYNLAKCFQWQFSVFILLCGVQSLRDKKFTHFLLRKGISRMTLSQPLCNKEALHNIFP